MENNHYKKNFLKEVIVRVDFLNTITELGNPVLPKKLRKTLIDKYPICELIQTTTKNIVLKENILQSSPDKITHLFKFNNIDRTKLVTLNEKFVSISFFKYLSFEQLKLDILKFLKEISSLNKEFVAARTGIRYVNIFDNKEYQDIQDNFDSMIASPFNNLNNDSDLNRLIIISEYLIRHEIKIRIQSGILNQDFPAKIKNKNFLLDIDAFIDNPHYLIDLEKTFETLHNEIQIKFESLITEKMRDKLNG